MGRSLFRSNSWLVASYDKDTFEDLAKIEIRSLENPLELNILASWQIDCSPLNAIVSPEENYLVVSCLGGDIWVAGLNKANLGSSSLKLVRNSGFSRRALYIYENESQALLFAFPTDMAEPNVNDLRLTDVKSFDPEDPLDENNRLKIIDGSNQVPDIFEVDLAAIRQPERRYPYQTLIYDLAAEKKKDFPYVANGSVLNETQADKERVFLYFDLFKDWAEQEAEYETDEERKFYRTNFWQVEADPLDAKTIYLSHRSSTLLANNDVIRLSINIDALSSLDAYPASNEIFSAKRVFGFASDNTDNRNFPGDFVLSQIQGQQVIVVNNFRDAVYWQPSEQKFSLIAKVLGEENSQDTVSEIKGSDFSQSFYQVAVSSQAKLLACSFYGNSVLLVDLKEQSLSDAKALELVRQIF